MSEVQSDPAPCDVLGCGSLASKRADASWTDTRGLGRTAVPRVQVCDHHVDWPFSEDAQRFALMSNSYKARK